MCLSNLCELHVQHENLKMKVHINVLIISLNIILSWPSIVKPFF